MADNYLERRMEDLRSGKIQLSNQPRHRAKPASPSSASKNKMSGIRVVITGGANGIGAEIVREFRKHNAIVDILDTDCKAGTLLAQSTGACFRPVDISDTEAFEICIQNILKQRGDIDIIVNNAAIVDFLPLEQNSASRMIKSLSTNVIPILEGARLLAIHRDNKEANTNNYGGRIINIASTRAFMSEEGTENYTASKGAIVSLTHALMMSLSKYGITVNCISPGWIHTGNPAELSPSNHLEHPSRRVGIPADIAKLCLFIASPESAFLNGENITIDGGHTHKMTYLS